MGTMSVGRRRVVALALVIAAAVTFFAIVGTQSTMVRAQEPRTPEKAPPIAVVDFVNHSGYGGDALGRSAADALVLAMDESKQFQPLQRAEVDQAMARLGFTLPLDKTAQAKLGREVEVDRVSSGVINDVHFEQTNEGRVAVVDLTVSVLNVTAIEYTNGARVTRSSTPKPGYTGDDAALVDEALTLATYQAVHAIVGFRIPRATVLSATPTDVYLNGGSRIGLAIGMELVVMRFNQTVGRVRVIDVEPTYATAAITENNGGITVGDTTMAVFEAPTSTQAVAARRTHSKSKLGNVLLGVAAAAGIYLTMSTHGPADQAVPNVLASSFSDPSAGARVPGVLVTWSPFHHEQQNVLGYEVFRNGELIYIQPSQNVGSGLTGSGNFFIDTNIPNITDLPTTTFFTIDSTTGRITDFAVNPGSPPTPSLTTFVVSGLVQTAPEAGRQFVYRVDAIVSDIQFSPGTGGTTPTTPTGGGTTPTGGTGGLLAASDVPASFPARAAAQQPADSRQAAPTRQWVIKESAFTGSSIASALDSPELTAPTNGTEVTDLTEVTFTWNAVDLADEYVLQISLDSLFLPTNTKTFTLNGSFPNGTSLSQTVNVAQTFPPPASGGILTLHWRVGARNTQDPVPPRTDPAFFQLFPQHQGHVWSTPGNSTIIFTGSAAAATAASRGQRRIRMVAPSR